MGKKPTRFKLSIASAKAGDSDPQIQDVQRFLTRFGYLSTEVATGKLDQKTSKALKLYQKSFKIKETGNLTPETIKTIESRRCSMDDLGMLAGNAGGGGAAGSYVLRGCKYNKRNFTYRFLNGSGDISGTGERTAVRNAFNTWASVLCGVTFTQRTSGSVDFLVSWHIGSHGDGYPFDGVGNVLAHAFYPPPCGGSHAGKCHFDEAETWSLGGSSGTIDMETVALHEIGHLLGLDHSTVTGSVMYPNYGGIRRNLTADDIAGIRRLYPYLCRRGDSGGQAGYVGEISAVKHRTRQVINAVRTQAGTLKLIAWRVNANGSVSRTGDSRNQAGRASMINIAKNYAGLTYVTALRTSSRKLKLISWYANSSGTVINRRGDSGNQAGQVELVNIVCVRMNYFVTAVRTTNDRLKLILWRLNGNGSITRISDSGNSAGVVREIATTVIPGGKVVTACRTSSGKLKLITWRVTNTITRIGDSANQAGNATFISIARDQYGHLITPCRTSGGNLKLITWRVNSSGSITRLRDSGSQAGGIREQDVTVVSGNNIITAVRTVSGNLKVLVWKTASNGSVVRVGDSDNLAGNARLITMNAQLSGASQIVTSVRTANSRLKLISWHMP